MRTTLAMALALLAASPLVLAEGPVSRAPHGPLLLHPSPPAFSGFGTALASPGDLDGDGYGDLAVGDPFDGAGAVLVYRGGPDGVESTPGAILRGAAAGDQFGAPLARGATASMGQAGRVYVYLAADLFGPAPAPALVAYGEAAGDRLGQRVAGGLDATGDGVPDLLATAFLREEGRGWAYLLPGHARGAFNVGALASASIRGEAPWDELGEHAIAFVPDVTGDGRAEWAVGAPEHDADRGRVYVVTGLPLQGDAALSALRVFQGDAPGDGFGFALATPRLPEGVHALAVGAFLDGAASAAAGRVHLLLPLAPSGLAADVRLSALEGFDGGTGGASLAAGDFDGDGDDDLVVGAPVGKNGTKTLGEVALLLGPLPVSGVLRAEEEGARILGDVNSGRFGRAVALVPRPDDLHPAGIAVGQPRGAAPGVHLLVNRPPVARAPEVETPCTGPLTRVALDGGGSTDPDGDADLFRYSWRVEGGLPLGEGIHLPVDLPVGRTRTVLMVEDVYLASNVTDGGSVRVVDLDAPQVRLTRPEPAHVYLQDDDLLTIPVPLVGWATHVDTVRVEAHATDLCSPIERVDFFLDDELRVTDREAPYDFEYDPHAFWPAFKHVFALAYDAQGNGPTAACMHLVNSAWVSPHHLPLVGEGPPDDFVGTLVPHRVSHAIAGETRCDDALDGLLPDLVHPLPVDL